MMGIEDLYLCTDDMRDHLIAWMVQAQACDAQATALSSIKEHRASALLMKVRDQLIARIMYVQEWADTHTEYPDDGFFKIPKDTVIDQTALYEWWSRYGYKDAVDLAEVVW